MKFPKPTRNKYNAVRTGDFPSKLEASVYGMLKLREAQGEIKDIKRYPSVKLMGGAVTWKIDFSFVEVKSGNLVYCEAKGVSTADFRLKLKIFKTEMPASLEIWRGTAKRPFLSERIEAA
jgi:hypothetical protein